MANLINVPFIFRIRSVTPNYEVQAEQAFSNGYWKPPTRRNAYNITSNTGWVNWRPSTCTAVPPNSEVVRYDTVSMFYASDRQAFLAVPYDCMTYHVRQRAQDNALDDWRRLRFDHVEQQDGSCISLIQEHEPHHRIGAPGSSNWMPELLPPCYGYDSTDLPEFTKSSLGGRLAILLGLAAFSRNPTTMSIVDTIRHHFRPQGIAGWSPHLTPEQANARTHEQGVVVDIAYLNQGQVTARHLERWEQGYWGPIIS